MEKEHNSEINDSFKKDVGSVEKQLKRTRFMIYSLYLLMFLLLIVAFGTMLVDGHGCYNKET